MGLLSVPSYQDYLAANPQNNGGSEGSGGFTGLSEEAWNKLSDAQKWQNVGSGIALAPSDPRYNDVNQQLGNPGGLLRLGYSAQSNPINSTYYVDPKAVAQDHGVFATNNQNLTPYSQLAKGVPDWFWPVMFAAGVAGGAAGSQAGIFSGTAPTVGEAGATGFTGYGSIAGSGLGAAGTAGGAAAANPSDSYWNMVAQNGQTDVPVGEDPYGGYTGGIDPETAGGQGGMGVGQNGIGPGTTGDIIQGTINNPGSLVDRAGGLLGDAGSWAMSHPLQAAGLLQTGYGLVHKPGSPSSGNSGSKGGNGSSGGNFSIPQRQFYVNPYIAAQIQRGYQ